MLPKKQHAHYKVLVNSIIVEVEWRKGEARLEMM